MSWFWLEDGIYNVIVQDTIYDKLKNHNELAEMLSILIKTISNNILYSKKIVKINEVECK